uniref:Secreted protein n=1 Tax=Rhizophora mucronata TaxID=61149 RepID=A0A2P2JY00_RHIMU
MFEILISVVVVTVVVVAVGAAATTGDGRVTRGLTAFIHYSSSQEHPTLPLLLFLSLDLKI